MSKTVSLGEIMLRLKSPLHERFFQSPAFEATFGGSDSFASALNITRNAVVVVYRGQVAVVSVWVC